MCFWKPHLFLNKDILIDLAVKASSAVKRSHAEKKSHKDSKSFIPNSSFCCFSSCGFYGNRFRCTSPQRHGWHCRTQGAESVRAGNPSVRCCPARKNVFCLEPEILNPASLKLPCCQPCWPGCPLPCPGRPGSSWATGGRWMSPSWVYSPEGPPAPVTAAGRHLEKCFCEGPCGCSWRCLTAVRCRISSWSGWWSWRWPGASTPRSIGCRSRHPAPSPRTWTNRRRESCHLEKEKNQFRGSEEVHSDWNSGWTCWLECEEGWIPMIVSPATMTFRNRTSSQQKRGRSFNYIISYVPELFCSFYWFFFIAGHG